MLIYAAPLPIWALTVSPILTVLIYYFCMYQMCIRDRLQGHLDMVCEKAPGCRKDMEKEGLDPVSYTHLDVYKRQGTTPARW